MGSLPQRAFIEDIRREKFGIGTTKSNPLAKMLHEAIVHLSAELYQKDIHFISELLQNAEDNVYGNGVSPSLELVLTSVDVARVGAQATLILFNNEVGFQPEHVEALCAVGLSTKKGKRDSGYIGEKGIGFKSVFLVTRTPYIISNGYRFRFTDEASNEAKIGYVVPEWVDVPSNADLRQVYGKYELPQTVIVLPLREDKIKPVRQQLKQVSPETLLFLAKLRQLVVREDSSSSLCITRSDILQATQLGDDHCKVATVQLALGSNVTHVSEESTYHLLQQRFPVTHGVEQRKEVSSWDITIAFPLRQRINPGKFSGDIYAFLPSELVTGFPFVINADFLLVASRETLKFDSPWNIGILSCVPSVFRAAFNFFLRKDSKTASAALELRSPAVAVREAYSYIPTKLPHNLQLQAVQKQIIADLKQEDCVLVDPPVSHIAGDLFCKPCMGRLIRNDYRTVLAAATAEGKVNPVVNYRQWYIVDREVQDSYSSTLRLLGVSDMTEGEYIECLEQSDWLLSLSEVLYWEVVCFVLDYWRSFPYGQMQRVPILKYRKDNGSIALATIEEAKKENGVKIYLSPTEKGEWLTLWTTVFKPWVSVLFMPAETVRVLKELKRKRHAKVCELWGALLSSVSDLSVKSYVRHLLELIASASDRKFIILTTEFVYQCIQGKDVEMTDVVAQYPRRFPLVNRSAGIRWINRDAYNSSTRILLPPHGSLWPKLSLDSGWSGKFVAMSDDYLNSQSASWTSTLSSKASVPNKLEDPLELASYRSYLKSILGAGDIPHLTPPDDAQMPKHVSSKFIVEQADVLLQWFATCQKLFPRNSFSVKLMQTEWLPTEGHGLRRPQSCFEKSSFSAVFKPSDVPFVHPSLSGYGFIFADLGVVTDPEYGCDAAVNYLLEMSNDMRSSACDLGQATRLYSYLQKFRWSKLTVNGSPKLKIFVPGDAESSYKPVWKESDDCVIHNEDGYFDNSLTVLENIYPRGLLNFFVDLLNVPRRATVERYCQLWLKWRSDVHQITVDECTGVWKILSEKWAICDRQTQKSFIAQTWVPCVSQGTGDIQLSSPSICFIPDDLGLRSLFASHPNVQFVWYPDNTEKMESALNKVYTAIGVRKLSECVEVEFTSTEISRGQYYLESELKRVVTGSGILCPELFRAILGFLARKKYGLSSLARQELLRPLTEGVVEISIRRPLTRSCTISCLSPPVTATENNVRALWSRTEPLKFYRVDNDNPELSNSLARRDFCTQVATTITNGLLSEHPLIVDDLTDFLIGLASSDFESGHVEYELRRKNARLYEEDEIFLSQLQTMFN